CDDGCRVLFDSAGTPFVLASGCGAEIGHDAHTVATPVALRLDSAGTTRIAGQLDGLLQEGEVATRVGFPANLRGAFGGSGNLYAFAGSQLVRIDGPTGRYTGVDIEGSAVFSNPGAVAFGGNSDLYVADTGNSTVRRIVGLRGSHAPGVQVQVAGGDEQSAK